MTNAADSRASAKSGRLNPGAAAIRLVAAAIVVVVGLDETYAEQAVDTVRGLSSPARG